MGLDHESLTAKPTFRYFHKQQNRNLSKFNNFLSLRLIVKETYVLLYMLMLYKQTDNAKQIVFDSASFPDI